MTKKLKKRLIHCAKVYHPSPPHPPANPRSANDRSISRGTHTVDSPLSQEPSARKERGDYDDADYESQATP
jgi:hypothetical protein